MRKTARFTLVVLALAAFAAPVLAGTPRLAVRLGVNYMLPTGDYKDGNLKAEYRDSFGASAGLEFRATQLIGVALDAAWQPTHFRIVDGSSGLAHESKVDVIPITLGVNFHFVPGGKVDLYAGPVVGWVHYGQIKDWDLGEGLLTTFSPQNEFTWGLHVGLDAPASGHVAFHAEAGLLDAASKVDASFIGLEKTYRADMRPLFVRVGLALHF